MGQETWAIGVDLGGTKMEVAVVDAGGKILQRLKQPTHVETGPDSIMAAIAGMVRQLLDRARRHPLPASGWEWPARSTPRPGWSGSRLT